MTNVAFRALPPDEFAVSRKRGDGKTVRTLRSDPIRCAESEARIQTRAAATDPKARAKFRLYAPFFSNAIMLIRLIALGLADREAKRQHDQGGAAALALLGNTQNQKVPRCPP